MKRILVSICLASAFAAIAWIAYRDFTNRADPTQVPAVPPTTRGRDLAPGPMPDAAPVERILVGTTVPPRELPAMGAGQLPVVLVGSLLFADGAPLVGAHCAWSIQGTNGSVSGQARTDDTGKFRIPGPTGIRGEPRMLRLRARWDDLNKPWAQAVTAIAADYPPGEHELGFLPVETLPLLAAGRVADVAGVPVPGAHVYAFSEQLDLAALHDEGHAERLSTFTDAEGRFAVHGFLPGQSCHLVARRADYYQTQPVSTPLGHREVNVELAAAGGLAGSVRVGPGITMQHLAVELSGPPVLGHLGAGDGPVPAAARPLVAGQSLRVPLKSDGTFEVGMLRPGQVDCAIRCIGLTEPAATFAAVQVQAGEVARDERLQEVDLRALRILAVTIVDAAGRPVEGLPVGVRETGKVAWETLLTGPSGRVSAVTRLGSIEVLVQQGGFGRQLLSEVRGDRTINLSRGLPVLLACELGDLEPEFEVAVQLVGKDADRFPQLGAVEVPRSELRVVEAGTAIEFAVPGPGLYRVVATVRVRGGPALHAKETKDLLPQEIEIPEGGVGQTVTVKLSKNAVRDAVRMIRHFFPTAGIVR